VTFNSVRDILIPAECNKKICAKKNKSDIPGMMELEIQNPVRENTTEGGKANGADKVL